MRQLVAAAEAGGVDRAISYPVRYYLLIYLYLSIRAWTRWCLKSHDHQECTQTILLHGSNWLGSQVAVFCYLILTYTLPVDYT
jgi:hypothetical protein